MPFSAEPSGSQHRPPEEGGIRMAPHEGLLRAGSVPYLNAAPLVRGLERRLRLLPPSQLAVALRQGEIDAALLSVSEPLLHDGYDILDGPCVASDGRVLSVFLAHQQPLAEASVIHCDTASLASVNLLRVLLAERGLHPRLAPLAEEASPSRLPFVLLIGDRAIAFQQSTALTHSIWDLGWAWRDLTGLPFVFAVWVLRRLADTGALRAELLAAADRGRRDIDAVIREAPGFDEGFRRRYFTENIRSWMGPREREAIRLFAELLRRHGGGGPVFEPRFVS